MYGFISLSVAEQKMRELAAAVGSAVLDHFMADAFVRIIIPGDAEFNEIKRSVKKAKRV